ncbi:hypothetical protein CPB84DRAFT_1843380 [Gymnopilus junonius]|uniref:Uncharacterized protein n=1 Tax=Gymnopilus junonius TaxID=109634 RepID=A0A9P5NWT4_GYMJU|nr:hypothetical protein CPB84DRAFT_1843380 [Gymnopilus junonius]
MLSVSSWFIRPPAFHLAYMIHVYAEGSQSDGEGNVHIYLDWELTVDNPILSNFKDVIKVDFAEDKEHRSYPDYVTTFVLKNAAQAKLSKLNMPFNVEKSSPVPVQQLAPLPTFSLQFRPVTFFKDISSVCLPDAPVPTLLFLAAPPSLMKMSGDRCHRGGGTTPILKNTYDPGIETPIQGINPSQTFAHTQI